jgi:hypothetical protein
MSGKPGIPVGTEEHDFGTGVVAASEFSFRVLDLLDIYSVSLYSRCRSVVESDEQS